MNGVMISLWGSLQTLPKFSSRSQLDKFMPKLLWMIMIQSLLVVVAAKCTNMKMKLLKPKQAKMLNKMKRLKKMKRIKKKLIQMNPVTLKILKITMLNHQKRSILMICLVMMMKKKKTVGMFKKIRIKNKIQSCEKEAEIICI